MKSADSILARVTRGAFGAVIATCVVALGYMATHPESTERRTSGLRARQFYRADGTLTVNDEFGAMGAAHNAGDDLAQLRRALRYGADIIEIDVAMTNGRLVAAHDQPMPLFGTAVFRGPSLEQAWTEAQSARAIMLDAKQSDRRYTATLVAFLRDHDGIETVVVSPSTTLLNAVEQGSPETLRFLSVGSAATIQRLQTSDDLLTTLHGVSVRETLIDETFVDWAQKHGLLVAGWVANDLHRVDELVSWGVDIITTDNLAVLEQLSGHERPTTSLMLRGEDEPLAVASR